MRINDEIERAVLNGIREQLRNAFRNQQAESNYRANYERAMHGYCNPARVDAGVPAAELRITDQDIKDMAATVAANWIDPTPYTDAAAIMDRLERRSQPEAFDYPECVTEVSTSSPEEFSEIYAKAGGKTEQFSPAELEVIRSWYEHYNDSGLAEAADYSVFGALKAAEENYKTKE